MKNKPYRPIIKDYYKFSWHHLQNARDHRKEEINLQYLKKLHGKKKLNACEFNQLLLFRDN